MARFRGIIRRTFFTSPWRPAVVLIPGLAAFGLALLGAAQARDRNWGVALIFVPLFVVAVAIFVKAHRWYDAKDDAYQYPR